MLCLPRGVPGCCFHAGSSVDSLAGGLDTSELCLAKVFSVHLPAVDMVSHLLFCWSPIVESALGRVTSHIDQGCLDTLPLVVILHSLCWALARQLVLVVWALSYFAKTSTLTKTMTRPRWFLFLFAIGRGNDCSPHQRELLEHSGQVTTPSADTVKVIAQIYRNVYSRGLREDRFLNMVHFCVDPRCEASAPCTSSNQ
jgi:hypothetical protein